MKTIHLVFASILIFFGCTTEETTDLTPENHMLNISFVMDPNAERQDNFGEIATMPAGNAGQDPDFEVLGLHFIGLYPDKFTPYDQGLTVFSSPTTEKGGVAAIDFNQELLLTPSENTISIPLSEISSGTYEYLRSSIGYQKFNLTYSLAGASAGVDWPSGISDDIDVKATLASFLGYNTYIEAYTINQETVSVNANKTQGYFGFESKGEVAGYPFTNLTQGDAPQTTVPNPINDSSPVPAGSCVVTGRFPIPLNIPENPSRDINIQVVISTNKSFEWEDLNGNGKYEPLLGEQVVDMGTRGFFPSVQ